jgi:hypothetical protein
MIAKDIKQDSNIDSFDDIFATVPVIHHQIIARIVSFAKLFSRMPENPTSIIGLRNILKCNLLDQWRASVL